MTCPTCGKPTDAKHRPFCSARCADVDLARWLRGDYRIPGGAADDEERPAPTEGDGRDE